MVKLFKKKPFFTEKENEQVVEAIRDAERMTSGEVRVFVESHCRFVDAMERAKEIFIKQEMQNTEDRNGIVLYIAMKDKQFAILGDEGIHQKVGDHFWKEQATEMKKAFAQEKYIDGITKVIREIGASLKNHFPYQSDDENELPDNIIFGK